MREILFRGKRTSDEKWIEGSLCTTFPSDAECYTISYFDEDIYYTEEDVDPETVGQFTGLTDKNGKKIFEDDILRIGYCFGWDSEQEKKVPEEEYISKVYSIDACPFCVDLQHCDGDMSPVAWLDWSYDDTEIEVIGNIHDNPELLKGGG